jgi:hypothetical protein
MIDAAIAMEFLPVWRSWLGMSISVLPSLFPHRPRRPALS